MDDETAYQLTRPIGRTRQNGRHVGLGGKCTQKLMNQSITTELHPGALRYYEEAGIATKASAITWCAARAFRAALPTQSRTSPT